MNTKSGIRFIIIVGLLLANISGHSQDSAKTTKPVVKKPLYKHYIPSAIKPPVQIPAQQPPAANQPLPVLVPVVIDHSLKGQFNDLIKKTYHYQQPALMDYNKSITDTLNTERRKFREAQKRLALQNKTIADLQNNVSTKDQSLTDTQTKLNQVSFLGIPMPKTTYNIIMWGLVLVLGGALIAVIYLSGSNKHEAAYRIKLYEELTEEFQAYKAKANDKEKKLARELQTERNKLDDLMGRNREDIGSPEDKECIFFRSDPQTNTMVNLSDYKDKIKEFISSTFDKFASEHYRPYVIGIYCCPRYGWVTLNFNITKDATMDNCPDFEFVEYDLISFEDWENALGHGDSKWRGINGKILKLKWDDGDDILNKLFFDFLRLIISELKQTRPLPLTFIQMLDSEYSELIK